LPKFQYKKLSKYYVKQFNKKFIGPFFTKKVKTGFKRYFGSLDLVVFPSISFLFLPGKKLKK